MLQYGLPIAYAILLWWLSTSVVMYLNGLPQRTFGWTMLGSTIVFGLSLYGLAVSSSDTSVAGAYLAFTYGLLVWGWQEVGYYLGLVTGPRRRRCAPGCHGWRHFGHALQTSIYHELSILASGAVVLALTWGEPNQFGTWTFIAVCIMHQSARLNVFLGVRNLNEEFLPKHLDYLKSFLTRRSMNPLFPVSITVSTAAAGLLVYKALAADTSVFDKTGLSLLTAMLVLGILEHWLLILPLPSTRMWNWALGARAHDDVEPPASKQYLRS